MKFLIPIITFVLVMGGLYPTVHAQEERAANRILMVDYFKVPPGGVEEYLATLMHSEVRMIIDEVAK